VFVTVLGGGCATQAERAAAAQREVDDMIKVYGPACEKLGFKADTDTWRNCVLRLADRESDERTRRSGFFTNCVGTRGFFQCSSF
jgi:alkyl sulfatase BDS1-like metallo-beta-lactamase superfamily hydrolase